MPRPKRSEETEIDLSVSYRKSWLETFQALNLHGMLTAPYLFKLQDQYINMRSYQDALKEMKEGGYIFIHPAHSATEDEQNCAFIYTLTNRGIEALQHEGLYEETIWPSGNDVIHQYGIAAVTGSIHIAAKEAGVEYIPGHQILKKNDTELYCKEVGLTPDQLFGLKFGDTWRVHAVEFERSYIDSRSSRNDRRYQNKSSKKYREKLEKYDRYIADGAYKKHLGTNTGMVALFVFTAPGAVSKFDRDNKATKKSRPYICYQLMDGFLPGFRPQRPHCHLFDEPWQRHGCDEFKISNP